VWTDAVLYSTIIVTPPPARVFPCYSHHHSLLREPGPGRGLMSGWEGVDGRMGKAIRDLTPYPHQPTELV